MAASFFCRKCKVHYGVWGRFERSLSEPDRPCCSCFPAPQWLVFLKSAHRQTSPPGFLQSTQMQKDARATFGDVLELSSAVCVGSYGRGGGCFFLYVMSIMIVCLLLLLLNVCNSKSASVLELSTAIAITPHRPSTLGWLTCPVRQEVGKGWPHHCRRDCTWVVQESLLRRSMILRLYHSP